MRFGSDAAAYRDEMARASLIGLEKPVEQDATGCGNEFIKGWAI